MFKVLKAIQNMGLNPHVKYPLIITKHKHGEVFLTSCFMESQVWKNTSTKNIFYLILLQIKVNVVNQEFGQV